ncbi:MAG: deoxyribose-phosphate aldolase [Odoribacteraceae bacterium]|jgi:deoxyribose-phosphate aldolase|nr:deoxyribose-phosphate aldolase [Odoribacteraceae bacterium]
MDILNELFSYHRDETKLAPVPGRDRIAYSREEIVSCMDYTSLEATDTGASLAAKIATLREKLKKHGLPDVASVCVYPRFAGVARECLSNSSIRTGVVAGGFPSAGTFARVKLLECRCAIEAGAEEIDVVIPAGEVLEKNYQQVHDELLATRQACPDVTLKAIIETGELKESEAIFRATLIAARAGVDFVKSSTGKTPVGATPAAVRVMCEALRQFHDRTGRKVGIKVAGGIASPGEAVAYMTIVRHELGEDWLAPRRFRIGASRLLDEIIKECKR